MNEVCSMNRCFNVEGACNPAENYMVNLEDRLEEIKVLIDGGKYFSINRARQYGKTTILGALTEYLQPYYTVVNLDFQLLSHEDFANETAFVSAFAREILLAVTERSSLWKDTFNTLTKYSVGKGNELRLAHLFGCLSDWCGQSEKPIVLMIDEVDSATNNQVFLDFLSQLRGYFI